jgi:DNA-binding IclR family transcriptional regulator
VTDSTIKSARRTLQVFELFAELRRPAAVVEIHRRLDIPQSSASKLLKTFRKMGYLQYDSNNRTYVPTLRTAVLSGWLHDQWFGNESMLQVMESLRNRLNTSVILGIQTDTHVLYMLALQAMVAPRPALSIGTLRPLCKAAVGKALLMKKTSKEIGLLVRRINAEEEDPKERINLNALLEDLAISNKRGFALSSGAVIAGVSVVAVPLPLLEGQPQMALGVGAQQSWMDENLRICVSALKDCLAIFRARRRSAANISN